MDCYNCKQWVKGREDGTCIHYINGDCPYGYREEDERKWCKFCKHGYPVINNGEYYVECCLSHFSYPKKKDTFDTCEHWEEDYEDLDR